MCGIVGYVGDREAANLLLQGLRRLEYRGYDSAGVAVIDGGEIAIRRSVGKLDNLERLLGQSPVRGTIGIGHTRWATHGRPSETNAHPHRAGRVVLIHNGIIENYVALKSELEGRGRTLVSETDTEVISHLIDDGMDQGLGFEAATRAAVGRLEGSFAIVVLCASEPDRLLAAKSATPMVIGLGRGENLIASDIPAVLDHTRDVVVLEDGEMAEVGRTEVRITRFDGTPVDRPPRRITWDPVTAQKGGFKHFLAKEIHEQPQAVIDTMRGRLLQDEGDVSLAELDLGPAWWDGLRQIHLVACGTAWHACLVGRFYLERLARVSCQVDYGSEFRYRDPVLGAGDVVLAVSQSGETADTLAALEGAKARGARTLAICNVIDSSIARRADGVLYTHAGPEISVASTKAFTCQLTALLLLALFLGRRRGVVDERGGRDLVRQMAGLMVPVLRCLGGEAEIEAVARKYSTAEDFLYIARGINYPIALEGALKLKELSYIHAEGYPAGELKHGPIALVSEAVPVVVLLPGDEVRAKTLSNVKEVESRGGQIIVVTDQPDAEVRAVARELIEVPAVHPLLTPLVLTLPLQMLAYHVAVQRGTDVDQPRNLAKSVTVE